MTSDRGADELWDAWCAASAEDPDLTPRRFAEALGGDVDATLALLHVMVGVVDEAPPSPLVDVLARELGPDGRPRFAGFRLEEALGQGASGMVFAAVDERADGPAGHGPRVALKILNPLLAAAPERRRRILHEAEVAGRLDHPGIVRVLDRGVTRGYAWIAMELVEGRGVEALVDDELSASRRAERATELGLQLADALAHAHANGVLHRDMKPANAIVDGTGRARILDFGLARADGSAFALSSTGEAVGTPLYMAPEQARGVETLGPWTDVYALGLILLELASGTLLVREGNALHALDRISRGRFRPPKAMLMKVERPLRDVLRRCLEPHPDDRYPSAEALLEDLEAVRRGRPLRWGAMPRALRFARRVVRNPERTALVLGSVVAAVLLARAWWLQPVEFWIGSFQEGKLIAQGSDGDLRVLGHTPALFRLPPGEHELLLHFPDPEPRATPRHARFRVPIEVLPHTPAKHFFLFEPRSGVPRLPEFPWPDAAEGHAWVQVATPLERMRVQVDGRAWIDTEGVVAFALPYGPHEVRVDAPAIVPIVTSFEIDGPELVFLSFDPAPATADRVTIPIYGPMDQRVRAGTTSMDGLRLYYETDNRDPVDLSRPVHKAYLGATSTDRRGELVFSVELPFAPRALDVTLNDLDCCNAGFLLIEMGASPDAWVPVLAWLPENLPEDLRRRAGAEMATLDNDIDLLDLARGDDTEDPADRARMDRLAAALEDRLWFRITLGGAPVGESVAFTCALRTNEMPTPASRGGKWLPAIELHLTR